MACFHPLQAWQLDSGEIVFVERGSIRRELVLPCGRCIGCRLVRIRAWSIRCMHEAQMHREPSSFVTLTYDGEVGPSLVYKDFQRFMYRLRRRLGPTRFFACGEYGEMGLRPHFHALLFGRPFSGPECGKSIRRSAVLERLWPHGFSSFGDVSWESAAYVAGYTRKKVSGERAEAYYSRVDVRTGEVVQVVPEFGRMSLNPGIGYLWFQKYWREVYGVRDGVVRPGGFVCPPPRYYDQLLLRLPDEVSEDVSNRVEFDRYVRAGRFVADQSPDRLAVREQCALAKARFLKRSLE